MKVALCTSEAVPFAKTGGMADVCGALPLELSDLNVETIVVMPKYKAVVSSGTVLKPYDEDFDSSLMGDKIRVYFLKNDMYLRDGLYGNSLGDYPDNLKRFSYFCQKSLELFKKIDFKPDIIHCHDWQTSLIPVFLHADPLKYFSKTQKLPRTLLTIHNISYQGIFPKEEMPQTGLGWDYFSISGLEYYDKVNLLKGGILYADHINTVSLTHTKEIQAKEFGCGIENVIASRRDSFSGILNGLDYKVWNPHGDDHIAKKYSVDNTEDKKINKAKLQDSCGLAKSDKTLLLGFVGRLVQQKGIELIIKALPQLCKEGIQTVILGQGEDKYESAVAEIAKKNPGLVFFRSCFDDDLAHRIYAGSDVFLMPSNFEPCGLGQLISFKYGTVPVVYKIGGLADTVLDYHLAPDDGNGFVFTKYDAKEFLHTVLRAKQVFSNMAKWQDVIKKDMRLNFSWKVSAKKYLELYEKIKQL